MCFAHKSLQVNREVDTLAQAKDIEETCTSSILEVVLDILIEGITTTGNIQNTHGSIRNEVPEAELVVAGNGVGNVPEEVCMQIVETKVGASG